MATPILSHGGRMVTTTDMAREREEFRKRAAARKGTAAQDDIARPYSRLRLAYFGRVPLRGRGV